MSKSMLEIRQGQLQEPINDRDNTLGNENATVGLVEYGDYECPYCAAAHPVVSDLLRLRSSAVLFAFRHFPLSNVHPHAEFGAECAEAAGAQDRYWMMHDWMFTHQQQLEPGAVGTAAQQMGMDSNSLLQAVSARTFYPKVQHDFMTGLRSGVNGTPTFFINGTRYDGVPTLDGLVTAIDAELG
jgi:protein-disulfide isomerase